MTASNRVANVLMRLLLAAAVLCGTLGAAHAEAFEPASTIRAAAARYVREQLPPALRPAARIRVQGPSAALHFPRCARLLAQAFGASGLFGTQTVQVRCAAPQRWSLYVPVQVDTPRGAVLALHALSAGHVLRASDLTVVQRNVSSLPAGTLGDVREGVGQVLRYSVAAGQAVTRTMLRGPRLVHDGQTVSLVAVGPGFRLAALGVALQDGSQGQVVMARNVQSGRVVRGVIDAQGEVLVEAGGFDSRLASNP